MTTKILQFPSKILRFKKVEEKTTSVKPSPIYDQIKQMQSLNLRYEWHSKGLSYDTIARVELLDMVHFLSNQIRDHTTFSTILGAFALRIEIDRAWDLLGIQQTNKYERQYED